MNTNTKYKFSMKGWFGESWRHMLSSKGIKSRKYQYVKLGDKEGDARMYVFSNEPDIYVGNYSSATPESAAKTLAHEELHLALDKIDSDASKQMDNVYIPITTEGIFENEGQISPRNSKIANQLLYTKRALPIAKKNISELQLKNMGLKSELSYAKKFLNTSLKERGFETDKRRNISKALTRIRHIPLRTAFEQDLQEDDNLHVFHDEVRTRMKKELIDPDAPLIKEEEIKIEPETKSIFNKDWNYVKGKVGNFGKRFWSEMRDDLGMK